MSHPYSRSSSQQTALVAGAAGFIGSHLCGYLLDRGYRVIGIDNLITGQIENLTVALAKGLEFMDHDICDSLNQDLEGACIDEVYNLASPASPAVFQKMPVAILAASSHGHKNLLELAHQKRARILFASSSEIYGDPQVHPQPESYCGYTNSFGPRSCYDEAKRLGEALNFAYHHQFGLEIRTARIFNTYGPHMKFSDGRVIPNFFDQALKGKALTVYGDGCQTRSLCFVSDMVEGLYRLMQSGERRPVNLGNPRELTILQVARVINTLTANTLPMRFLPLPPEDPKRRLPDISRARESLGWTPKVSLEAGLLKCLAYFKRQLDGGQEVSA